MSAPEIPGYRELRELGRGGGGRVVLAEHLPTGTWVAVKHLSERLAAEPEFVAAFRHEARSSSPAKRTTGPSTATSSSRSSAPPSASSPTKPSGPPAAKVLTVTAALTADPGPGTAPVRVTVTVTTADTSPVTLTLCYAADLGTTAGPPWDVGPSCDAPRTLQGTTTYTVSEVYAPPRNCFYPYVQVAATTGPAAPGGPAVASFNDADCIF